MNVFGAFTFGGLIKTFIPGCVWLGALLLAWRALRLFVPALSELPFPETSTGQQNALVLAIPVAILLGLLSNIVVFMGFNDLLVRNPVRRNDWPLFELYDWLVRELRTEYWGLLKCGEARLQAAFSLHSDVELLTLQAVGVENLAYVREQYWFHMEFQVNLLLATFVMLLSVLAPLLDPGLRAGGLGTAGWQALAFAGLLSAFCWLLLAAARKNYRKHIAKMSSVIAATICAARKAADVPAKAAGA
jgi:hypothetical protein